MVGDGGGLGEVVPVAATVGLGHGVPVAPGEAEALPDGVMDADAEGVAAGVGVGVAVGVGTSVADGLTDGLADPDALGAMGVTQGVFWTRTPVLPAVVVAWWVSSRAAGTTIIPMATVSTNASAPHSRRQKAHELFRIRGRRPFPASAYCGC